MASTGAVNLPASVASASRIEGLDGWLTALSQPSVLTELAALGACVLLAWLVPWLLNRTQHLKNESSILFGRRIVDGVLFPLLLLSFAYVMQTLLARLFPLALFKVAIPVLVALAVIRLSVKVLQVAFKNAPVVRAL